MTQRHGTTRMFGVMQELQQLRNKVSMLSEKNRELAKALTATKQELTKARTAQNAVFSNKVVEWMETQYKPVKVQHQATQCNFEEFDGRVCMSVSPSLSLLQCGGAVQTSYSELTSFATTNLHDKTTMTPIKEHDALDNNMQETETNSEDNGPGTEFSRNTAMLSPRLDSSTKLQTDMQRQLRQRDVKMSYVEPKLNVKLRRGDYYGLGKRTGPNKTRRSPKARTMSGPRRAQSPFVLELFEQCSNSICRRTRPVTRVSYAEPKLNTKLRQGDKFTFTT